MVVKTVVMITRMLPGYFLLWSYECTVLKYLNRDFCASVLRLWKLPFVGQRLESPVSLVLANSQEFRKVYDPFPKVLTRAQGHRCDVTKGSNTSSQMTDNKTECFIDLLWRYRQVNLHRH